jgi:MoxR-like ATPase
LSKTLVLENKRIQFTPDLLPGDITGNPVLQEKDGKREFVFQPGPLFANLVLADEINRASPKTQSALLEAMSEGSVSVDDETRALPNPFLVIATQNPLEQEGTYPLPEAQLDRFLVQIDVEYPDRDTERDILIATTGAAEDTAHEVFSADALIAAQGLLRRMPVGERVVDAILDLVRACRPGEPEAHEAVQGMVAWGPGPRAAQALMLTVRARALLQGRLAPSLEDVAAMARPVLSHRMALGFAARAQGANLADIIDQVAAKATDMAAAA